MATQVFLYERTIKATTHRGTNTARQDTTTTGWEPSQASTTRGSTGVGTLTTSTVAGPTNGVEVLGSAVAMEWLTEPVDQDVTISGTITFNIWAAESSMNANVAINCRIDKVAATDGTLTTICTTARTTELATSSAVNNFTATPTSTNLNKGDRLRFVIFGNDSTANMASGFTFTAAFGAGSAGINGDTYITFDETFGFQTTDPTGTTLYLTNTASAVVTADTDYEAWTSRGDAADQTLTTPGTGWRAPVQLTESSGGTAISWFTKPLQSFTLSGLVKCNIRARESAGTANASLGVEIARVDGDGTNATVWGYANRDAATTSGGAGELASTSETAYTVYVSGDDLAISDGQRIRIRVFFDDCADIPAAGGTVSIWHDGPTGGASGDTYLIFGQTLTESTPGVAYPFARRDRTAGLRDTDPWSLTGWRS